MIRRFTLAALVVAFTFTFAYSETFQAKVTKVEGNKITYQKGKFDFKAKKFETSGDPVTTEAIKDVEVVTAGFGKGKKGEPLEGGLTNEMFKNIDKEKGVVVTITTADDGDNKGKITKISTFKKKAAQ
jgi:hypothetical protein